MLLYFAGSMIMYEPSEECIIDFWTKGIIQNLPVSSSNPNFIKAALQLRSSCADPTTCSKLLQEDYILLFSERGSGLAPPYESLYMKNDSDYSSRVPLLVSEFYNSYGWKSKFRGKINDDHLAVELLFLTILVEKYLVLDDDACQGEMRTEIRRFIHQHILSWVDAWNENIQKNAKSLCYKGIGTLILACVQDIYSYLDNSMATFFQSLNLKN